VELEVAVELGDDVELRDRSLVYTLACIAREAGGLARVGRRTTSDALATERPIDQAVTLAERILAGEAGPLETTIAAEASSSKIGPVETRQLLVDTLVVGVGGRAERESTAEALRRSISTGLKGV
jgi:hypothetical protein